jgi:hypothetical protein
MFFSNLKTGTVLRSKVTGETVKVTQVAATPISKTTELRVSDAQDGKAVRNTGRVIVADSLRRRYEIVQ